MMAQISSILEKHRRMHCRVSTAANGEATTSLPMFPWHLECLPNELLSRIGESPNDFDFALAKSRYANSLKESFLNEF